MSEIHEEMFVTMVRQKIAERDRLPLEHQILRFLSETGYATENQLVRLFEGKFTVSFIESEVQKLKRAKKLESLKVAPPRHLRFDLERFNAFYATEKGRGRLAAVDQEAASYGRFGKPRGENLKRVTHELLATESYIWFVRNGKEVIWFLHENQLKKALGRKRWKRIREHNPVPFVGEATGDYKICVADRESWRIETHECEVAVRYSCEQLRGKPKNLKWFCLTDMQARNIEKITGEKANVMRGFIEHEQLKSARATIDKIKQSSYSERERPNFTERKERIVGVLERIGGGCTGNVVARELNISASQLRNIQDALVTDERVSLTRGFANHGVTRGRSSTVWYLSGLTLSVAAVELMILRSLVLENFYETGWALEGYDEKLKSVMLRKGSGKIAFRIDTFGETDAKIVAADAVNIENVIKLCAGKGIKFKFVCILRERFSILAPLLPKQNLIDLSGHGKLISVKTRKKISGEKIEELEAELRAAREKETREGVRTHLRGQNANGVLPF